MFRPIIRSVVLSARGNAPHSLRIRCNSTTASSVNSASKKTASRISIILASFLLGAGTAQVVPLSEIAKFVISESLPESNSPQAARYQEELEEKLRSLPLYKELSNDPNYESKRAWNYIDSNTLSPVITTGSLSVPGGFAIKPIIFYNKSQQEATAIVHVGEKLCGYPFLVHGGILATILDDILKRSSSYMFGIDPINEYTPDKIKTKNIELQYKFPTLANNFLVVRTKILDGKVVGDIETTGGRLLVKGVGQFEERKMKKKLGLF